MKNHEIAEALTMGDGVHLEAIAGTVTAVRQRYEGTSKFGPWSFQSLVLDEGGASITAKLKNRGVVAEGDFLGKRVVISGVHGKKGLTGVKVDLDEYEGVTSKIVIISANALIERAEVALARPDPQPELSPARSSTTPPAAAPTAPAAAPEGEEGMSEAQRLLAARKAGLAVASAEDLKKAQAAAAPPATTTVTGTVGSLPVVASTPEGLARRIEQLIRLRVHTMNAAAALSITAEQAGITVTPEHLQAIDSWMAIALEKGGFLSGIDTTGERPSFQDFRRTY